MPRRILVLFTTGLLAFSHAAAGELDELAEALRKGGEALASSAAGDKKPDRAQQQQLAESLRTFTEFDQALTRGDAAAARAVAGRLEMDPTLPQSLRETASRLRRDLPALLDAREDAFVAIVNKLVAKTRSQCLAATNEADLQALLREASQIDQSKLSAQSPYAGRAIRRYQAAIALIRAWMDYLAAKEAGNAERAGTALRHLAGENKSDLYPILPEAEIRRRLEEADPYARPFVELSAQLRGVLARVKSLRDVPILAPEIAALPIIPQTLHGSAQEQESLQKWFAVFTTTTAALSTGDLDDAWERAGNLYEIGSQSWGPEALRLRALLVSELIAKSLRLSPAQTRRPDETMTDHLLRIAREAAREHHWEEVERIQQLYETMMDRPFNQPNRRWWADSSELASAYLEGRRLETAGDAPGAVAAYLRVLRGTGELVPTAEAQERLRALLDAQKATLTEVRTRLDAERLTGLMQRLETNLAELKKRADAAERAAQIRSTAAPVAAAPATGGAEIARLDARLKKLEAVAEKLGEAASQTDGLQIRLSKLETLLAPALEAAPGAAAETKVRLWLGPDFTVYRSAVPPALDGRLGWVVRFNGKTVLMRNAKREMQFNYGGRKPGIYTIYLTGADGETPSSNVIDYTLTEEAAKKLGPQTADDDWDRDGARNPPAPRGQ